MRQPKPWFRAALNAWYVEHNGKQVRLGEHPEDVAPPKKSKAGWNPPQSILDAFYKLMASDPASFPKPDRLLVRSAIRSFSIPKSTTRNQHSSGTKAFSRTSAKLTDG